MTVLRRSPTPVFNEKILCGLGKGVAITGKLNEAAIVRALAALRRFRTLAKQIGCKEVFAVATAAAREASNGEEFVDKAEKALGAGISVLTGKEEARFAALGVIAGIPDADGVAGDLGGGSLELIDIKDGKLNDGVTLPLGPLRLMDMSGNDMERAKASSMSTCPRPTSLRTCRAAASMPWAARGETLPACTWPTPTIRCTCCTSTP